ncbi:IS110 family transposase [Streptacidiphilus monticola]|uniref:Transposase n=1 Tax=Streptacidiphilus monticola TaxID=2161674 RepID=A0ABW1GBE6_9ACTN
MSTIAQQTREITGVDTHKDTHTAAAVNAAGRVLGAEQFEANTAGYREFLAWLRSFGTLVLVGVEGTGAYGAGLARSQLLPVRSDDRRPPHPRHRLTPTPPGTGPHPMPGPARTPRPLRRPTAPMS